MRISAKILAGLLLAGMAVASSPEPLLGQAASAQRPAGCHRHPRGPQPQPIDYTCCQTGHRAALLQKSAAVSPPWFANGVRVLEAVPVLPSDVWVDRSTLSWFLGSPPGVTPLRI